MQPGNLPQKAKMVLQMPEAEPKSWREPVDRAERISLTATGREVGFRGVDGASGEGGASEGVRIPDGTSPSKKPNGTG